MNTEKFMKNWEKQRKKGKLKFVLIFGLWVSFGSSAGYLLPTLVIGKPANLSTLGIFGGGCVYFIAGFLGGVLGSSIQWNKKEEQYNDLIKK